MFTPQEIQEKTFEKAVFGGYDMQTVDAFLEPLTQDYITLYRENAVLKSKMKVLVEKLEEYRAQEQNMRSTILSAQRTADAMMAEAERKCAKLMDDAGAAARSKDADAAVARETERMNNAKKTAKNFIEVLEQDIRGHLELLEKLKNEDLTEEPIPEPAHKIYDFDREEAAEQRRAEPEVVETAADIADAIGQNIGKIMEMEAPEAPEAPAAEEPKSATENTIKFTNLQFGRNYDPTNDA